MKTMKHFLCLVLTLILCFQSAVPVYAAEAGVQTEESFALTEEETDEDASETTEMEVVETEVFETAAVEMEEAVVDVSIRDVVPTKDMSEEDAAVETETAATAADRALAGTKQTRGGAVQGIKNNGLGGIYIDVNASPYSDDWATDIAYTSVGCTWFVASRVLELTGKSNFPIVYGCEQWWDFHGEDLGFRKGTDMPACKAVIVYTGHVAILEAIDGDTVYISEGGWNDADMAQYGYTTIRAITFGDIVNRDDFIGFVYLDECPFDREPPYFDSSIEVYPLKPSGIRFSFDVDDDTGVKEVKLKVWQYGKQESEATDIKAAEYIDINHWNEHGERHFYVKFTSADFDGFLGPFEVSIYITDFAGNEAIAHLKKPISFYTCKPDKFVTGTYKAKEDGTVIRCAPYATINGKNTRISTIDKDKPISVIGSYTNSQENVWYQTDSGSWIYSENVKHYSLFMMIRDFLENFFGRVIVILGEYLYPIDSIPDASSNPEEAEYYLDWTTVSVNICRRPVEETGTPISLATISFNPNGGTVGVGSISCLTGDEIGPMPTPYRFGYEFDGWFTVADGGDQVYEDSTCSGNMTLYAHWTRIILMEGECGDNLHFILYGDGILDITGSGEMNDHPWTYEFAERVLEVNLPDGLTAICDHAFEDSRYMETFTIPGSVKRIEDGTFKNCTYLENITLPDTITYVGAEAFYKCETLKKIILTNVTEIEQEAFYECFGLAQVQFGNKLNFIGRLAFNSTPLTEIYIPKSLDRCGCAFGSAPDEGPFSECANLKNVTFETGITSIPEGVFAGCTGLESIVIPDTVTKIEENSFAYCTNLSKVTFSQSLTEIDEGAFYSNVALTQVVIPDSVRRIDTDAFAESSHLSKATLPKRLTFLAARAFANTALTEITIPKSLDYCGYYLGGSNDEGPFMGCSNLKTVHFEDGIESIPEGVFAGCNGLQEVVIPDTVEILEDWCFAYCKNLSKITLGSQVQKINDGAFSWDSSLKEITLPETVTRIGSECFSGSGIERIRIPAGVDGILWGAFRECTALTQVSLPEGGSLEYIENDAFWGCSALTEMSIPLGVISINGYAFYNCLSLQRVVIPDSVTYLEDHIFYNCDSLTEVSLGKGITYIPGSTFEDCDSLESILIPYRVTEIGPDAFKNDVSLTSITIPKSVTFIDESTFSYPQNLTIYGVAGSYAEEFANENDIRFVAINVPAEQVTLSETNLQLNVYDTAMLYLTITPENFTDDVVWESSDPNVVRVDENGQMRAIRGGLAEITVTVGNVSASCTVQVYQPVYHISIWPYTVEVEEGETLQLTATIDPENATNKSVLWSSSDESIASVDENGLVTANAAGTAEITATSEDNADISDSCIITVKEAASEEQIVTSIALNKESAELDAGETVQLTATVLPENATDKTIQWYSTNTSVASVSGNGLVTAKAPGKCMITATAADRGVISAVCAITVKETSIQATNIYFMSDSGEWAMGRSFALIAHITPENATDYTVTWSSSNPAIAEVNDGMVSVKAYGTATITATLKSGSLTKSASYTVKALFNDVMDNSQYYYKPVYWAADKGITTGYSDGSFGVGRDCQRRELLIFMWRFAGSPTKDKKGVAYGDARKMFNDMNAYGTSSAANKAVAWAYKEGIVKGYSDGGIHPTASIVRKDVMIMLYRLAGKPAVSGTLTFPDCKSFKTTSDTYKAILWGSKNKITNGYSNGPYAGQFGVNLNCLREQIVTFLYRYNNIK